MFQIPSKDSFDTLSALDIAEQLTYLDHQIFIAIRSESVQQPQLSCSTHNCSAPLATLLHNFRCTAYNCHVFYITILWNSQLVYSKPVTNPWCHYKIRKSCVPIHCEHVCNITPYTTFFVALPHQCFSTIPACTTLLYPYLMSTYGPWHRSQLLCTVTSAFRC